MTAAALSDAWQCCHLGAREHYAVPRGLHHVGRLSDLVTDAWVRPGSIVERLPGETPRRLRERYHPELADVPVTAFTRSLLGNEAIWRARGLSGWGLAIERNRWFQRRAAAIVARSQSAVVFAHSYAALEIFRAARRRGSATVLGQIDPGPQHFAAARALAEVQPVYGSAPADPPQSYFDDWREECSLADRIIVNSQWSRESLERAGVAGSKVSVIPLPYEPDSAGPVAREYPQQFSATRPMRVLFVGTASAAKGVPELLEAIRLVHDLPIHLELVGGSSMAVSDAMRRDPMVTWTGPVVRSVVMDRYRASDLLVFPSHSDGFGMAQVEARGWRLPIAASRHCGAVVTDGKTGWLLPSVTPAAIADVLREAVSHPELLRQFSAGIAQAPVFTIADFGRAIAAVLA